MENSLEERLHLRSKKHYKLVQKGVLSSNTLNEDQVFIKGTRTKHDRLQIQYNKKNTCWSNVKQVCEQLGINPYEIIERFHDDFEIMKVIIDKKNIMITFPGKEMFIEKSFEEYFKSLGKDIQTLNENLPPDCTL